jgi:hypothetical protein
VSDSIVGSTVPVRSAVMAVTMRFFARIGARAGASVSAAAMRLALGSG